MANDLTTFPVTTVKVTELPSHTTVVPDDVLLIVDDATGESKQTTVGDITSLASDGSTNLTSTASPTGVSVNSDTGTNATIGLADGTNAGLISPAEKDKLDNLSVDQSALDTLQSADISENTANIAINTDAISSNDTNISDLVSLSGIAANETDLGTFTGDVIPDASTVKEALQAIETNSSLNNVSNLDPSASNDNTEGYSVNSTWTNTATGNVFKLVDPATGAANWKNITAAPTVQLLSQATALKPHIGNSTLEYSMYSNNLAIRTGHGSASTLFIRANGKQRQIDVPTEFPNGRAGDNITGVSVLGNTVWVFIYNSVITRSNRLYKITGSELDVDTVVITEIDTTTNGVLVPNNSTAQSVQFVVDENETFYVNRDGGVTAGSPSLIRKFTVNASNVAIDGGNVTLAGTLVTVPSSFVVRGNGDFIATDINENFEIFDSAGISTFSESNYVSNGESNILLAKEGNNEVLFFYKTNIASSEVATAVPLF